VNWHPFVLSLQVAVPATAIVVVVGTAFGWVFARVRFWGSGLVQALLMLPLVLPPSVVGYYLLRFLGRGGPVQEVLGVNVLFTWVAAVLASAIVALPLMLQAARAAIAGVDPVLEKAARTLGSSGPTVFVRVTLPLARRGLLAGAILSGARALGEFGATLMVAGNIPGRTQTMPLYLYDLVLNGEYGTANVVVGMLTAFGLGCFLLIGAMERRSG
jgi:molybdate transport system permease protein